MPHDRRLARSPACRAGPALVLALVGAACGEAPRPAMRDSPALLPLGEIVLEQDGAAPVLASPGGLLVDDAGLWVTDLQQGALLRYDRSGRFERAVGRAGGGPGEFRAPFRLVRLGDDTLGVFDVGLAALVELGADDTELVRRPLGTQLFATSVFARGDSLLLGGVSLAPLAGALWLNRRTGAVRAAAPADTAWRAVLTSFEIGTAAPLAGGVLAVHWAMPHAMLHADGGSSRAVRLPARTRPVPPADLREQLLARRLPPDSARARYPAPIAAGVLPGGDVVLVHVGVRWDAASARASWRDGHVSVVRAAGDSACADAPLVVESDELPVVAFRGDTLYLLEQLVAGDRAEARLRAFTVGTQGCAWLPVVDG